MPNLVGENLQRAQDRLQRLGSYSLNQEDATSLGRFQLDDSNWVVCRQAPEAGIQTSTETRVTLWSVKSGERCPNLMTREERVEEGEGFAEGATTDEHLANERLAYFDINAKESGLLAELREAFSGRDWYKFVRRVYYFDKVGQIDVMTRLPLTKEAERVAAKMCDAISDRFLTRTNSIQVYAASAANGYDDKYVFGDYLLAHQQEGSLCIVRSE